MSDPKMKFLVVDDFSTMRRIVRGLLKELGFLNVDEAEDGVVALAKLKSEAFDFVVSDWNMPNMTGIDLLRAILWHHDYAALADGTAGVSPVSQRNIAVTLAAQYVYCLNKMGLHDAEWKRGATFALAHLGLAQTELDVMGKKLMEELDAG